MGVGSLGYPRRVLALTVAAFLLIIGPATLSTVPSLAETSTSTSYSVSGIIEGLDGNPRGGQAVRLMGPETEGDFALFAETESSADTETLGGFDFNEVLPGIYRLDVFNSGFIVGSSEIEVESADLTAVTVFVEYFSISGAVSVEGDGSAVEGVTVEAFYEDADLGVYWSAETETDSEGNYTLVDVPGFDEVQLKVTSPEEMFQEQSWVTVQVSGQDVVEQDFSLVTLATGSLSLGGQLLNQAGSSAGADILVGLSGSPGGAFVSFSTSTDSEGNFLFQNLVPGDYSISVWESEQYLGWFSQIELDRSRTIFPALFSQGTKTVTIFAEDDSGNPVTGLTLWGNMQLGESTWWYRESQESEGEPGRYSLVNVPSGNLEISRNPIEGFFQEWDVVRVNTTGSGPFTTTIVLTRLPEGTATIKGTITDKNTGSPIEGAHISVSFSENVPGSQRYFGDFTVSDEDGEYKFENLWPGQYWLWVDCAEWNEECEGAYDGAWALVRIVEGQALPDRDFALTPLPPADSDLSFKIVTPGNVPAVGVNISAWNQRFTSVGAWGETGSDGQAEFELPAGTYYYSAYKEAEGFADYRPKYYSSDQSSSIVRITPDKPGVVEITLEEIDYSASAAQTVSGTLTDQTGTPIRGASIQLYSNDGMSFWAETAANGTWSIPSVPHGFYTLDISPPNIPGTFYTYSSRSQNVQPGVMTEGLNLVSQRLLPGSASLTVVTRDKANHQRVSGETIYAYYSGDTWDAREGVTVNGEVTFENLLPGSYWLWAESGSLLFETSPEVTVGTSGSTTVTMRGEALDRRGKLTVNVREFVDGNTETDPLIDGAWVSIYVATPTAEGETFTWIGLDGQTNSGQVTFDNVPLGRQLEISVNGPWSPPGADEEQPGGLVPHTERFTLRSTDLRTIDVFLVPGGYVTGSVSPPSPGESVSGLYVVARSALTGNWVSGGDVNRDGEFIIDLLPTGTYDLVVEDWRNSALSVQNSVIAEGVQVLEGQETSVGEKSLLRGGIIEGQVTVLIDGETVPLPSGRWVEVQLLDANGDPVPNNFGGWASGHSQGIFTIRGVDPEGTYKLRFSDGFQYAGGYGEARLYETVVSDSAITFPTGVLKVSMDQTLSIREPSVDPVLIDIAEADESGDLKDAVAVDSSVEAGTEVSIFVATEMAGEWVAIVANSTPQLLTRWVQVGADGQVVVAIPSDLDGDHRLAVQDASFQVVGWVDVAIAPAGSSPGGTSRPGPQDRTDSSGSPSGAGQGTRPGGASKSPGNFVTGVVPVDQLGELKQWLRSPSGPPPAVDGDDLGIADGGASDGPSASDSEPPLASSEEAVADSAAATNGSISPVWWTLLAVVLVAGVGFFFVAIRARVP